MLLYIDAGPRVLLRDPLHKECITTQECKLESTLLKMLSSEYRIDDNLQISNVSLTRSLLEDILLIFLGNWC